MPNKDGARCLHTAARAGHIGVVNAILAKGEHVDVTTNVSQTKYRQHCCENDLENFCPYLLLDSKMSLIQGNIFQR